MRKVYEIKRHKVVDMLMAYRLGSLHNYKDNIDRKVDATTKEINSLREHKVPFTVREKVEIEALIRRKQEYISELKSVRQSSINNVYNYIRATIGSENVIGIHVVKEHLEIIEFDVKSKGDYSIMPKEDEEGKWYIEIE